MNRQRTYSVSVLGIEVETLSSEHKVVSLSTESSSDFATKHRERENVAMLHNISRLAFQPRKCRETNAPSPCSS